MRLIQWVPTIQRRDGLVPPLLCRCRHRCPKSRQYRAPCPYLQSGPLGANLIETHRPATDHRRWMVNRTAADQFWSALWPAAHLPRGPRRHHSADKRDEFPPPHKLLLSQGSSYLARAVFMQYSKNKRADVSVGSSAACRHLGDVRFAPKADKFVPQTFALLGLGDPRLC